jgi:hypothetical protein
LILLTALARDNTSNSFESGSSFLANHAPKSQATRRSIALDLQAVTEFTQLAQH